jgi:hypothetical protein
MGWVETPEWTHRSRVEGSIQRSYPVPRTSNPGRNQNALNPRKLAPPVPTLRLVGSKIGRVGALWSALLSAEVPAENPSIFR